MAPWARPRRILSWLLVAAAVVISAWRVVAAVGSDPSQGEGWIAGPIEVLAMGVPLLLVGLGLRSDDRTTARRTGAAATGLAALVAFVLVMQLFDPHETGGDQALQVVGLSLYTAAALAEVPLARDREVRSGPRLHHR